MLRNKPLIATILIGAAMSLISGCYKDRTVIIDDVEEITRPVSFATDILPIFNSSCNLSGCHSPGGKSPDLTAANALNALTIGNYINTASPENSELYKWVSGKRSTVMPVGGINKDYNALILAWIKQGSQNN